MGFDEETKDGHRVYWAEKHRISIERKVKFNFEPDEVIVGDLPLEGENSIGEHQSNIDSETTDQLRVDHPGTINSENHPISVKTEPEPSEGQGKHIHKETEYMRLPREGSGVTGERGNVLPKGMQHGSATTANKGPDIDHAMATVIESTQGLSPTYAEARRRPDWPEWEEAIKKELKGLNDSGTWRLVKCPPNTNIVDSKWVLKIKKNAAGEIDKSNAQLVALGFTQIYGMDYYKTYSLVARLASFCLLMAIAARNSWALDNFNFNQAFLNSKLGEDEIIYLEQPPGYELKDQKEWVFRLLKALYGLKQGLKNWYDALHKAFEELCFTTSEAVHSVFFKQVRKDIILLAIHVDDGMVTGNNVALIKRFKEDINKKYKITDLGPMYLLLGIKITRDLIQKTILLSQQAYVKAIITKFNFNNLKPSAILMDPSAPLSKSQSPTKLDDIAKMRNVPYQEAVGSLIWEPGRTLLSRCRPWLNTQRTRAGSTGRLLRQYFVIYWG